MKKIMLLPSQKYLKELFSYCPTAGKFTRLQNRGNTKVGDRAGTVATQKYPGTSRKPKSYRSISIDFKMYREHRLAWIYMTGQDPKEEIDHIDGDGLNNKWCNLRQATKSQNGMNKAVKFNSKAKTKGVWIRKNGNFAAEIIINKKKVSLGVYKTLEEAKAAYKAAAKLAYGEFHRA